MPSLLWFRRDLRLRDLPALLGAADDQTGTLACFVLDPRLEASSGARRLQFLGDSLRCLTAALDGRLLITRGRPEEVVPQVCRAIDAGAVHISADFSPFGLRRDAAVGAELATAGIDMIATGSPYLVSPGRVTKDDGPRAGTTKEKLAELKPAFRPDGTVTAGNACPLNDGAAAVIVMSDTKARELGITPIARVVSSAVSALNPEIMGLGPVDACRMALARAGMTINDIDLVEINEAFAAQAVPSAKQLGISWDKLNVNGGAIALGHPFGMTG
ncbi:MAG: hypothetical protein EBU54_04915, partial [Mycobacteriaceae bacterium]|nr:hypothetical protein [Mycobacteriaceae bacterium]